MRDELDDRAWTENHSSFSADVDRLIDRFALVFRKLVAIEYEAPWQVVARQQRHRC